MSKRTKLLPMYFSRLQGVLSDDADLHQYIKWQGANQTPGSGPNAMWGSFFPF